MYLGLFPIDTTLSAPVLLEVASVLYERGRRPRRSEGKETVTQ